MNQDEIRVLSPSGILGYGFPKESFEAGMAAKPDVIAIDAGSTDPGPYYLGSGKSFTHAAAVKRDLSYLLPAAVDAGIPLIIGTAGGAGADVHVSWCRSLLMETAEEYGVHFDLAVIRAEVDKQRVLDAIDAGKMKPLARQLPVSRESVERATRIVAQMGVEPIIKALQEGAGVVLAGRAYDPAVFAALPILRGFPDGLAIHMGKILECGAIAAEPGSGRDCALGILRHDSFEIRALSPQRRFTAASAAAHTLYEKSDPLWLPGPGGVLDVRNCAFDDVPGGVRVSGSRHARSTPYTLKLEGAERVGFRTVSIAGVRDPIMISQIDHVIDETRRQVFDDVGAAADTAFLDFKVYGKNGVMGAQEPVDTAAHELGIIIEAVAESQDKADLICSLARSTMLHYGYPGRIATAGNLAFPFSPSDLRGGEVYRFCVYHLMEVDDPCELFPIRAEYM